MKPSSPIMNVSSTSNFIFTPRSAALIRCSSISRPVVSGDHKKVCRSILSEAESIALRRQSRACGPLLSITYHSPGWASLMAAHNGLSAEGFVISASRLTGLRLEQAARNNSVKKRNVRRIEVLFRKSLVQIAAGWSVFGEASHHWSFFPVRGRRYDRACRKVNFYWPVCR